MSLLYRCEVCDATDPTWNVTRLGDVVTTWACDDHLAIVCDRLQRDYEITELVVVHRRKAREWADILVEGVAKTLWARRKTEEQQRDAGGWPSPFADEYRADARAAMRALTEAPKEKP